MTKLFRAKQFFNKITNNGLAFNRFAFYMYFFLNRYTAKERRYE